jgi:DNA-binding PucR family transcriptional regulator
VEGSQRGSGRRASLPIGQTAPQDHPASPAGRAATARVLDQLERKASELGKTMADAIRDEIPAIAQVASYDPSFPARLDRHCREHVNDFVVTARADPQSHQSDPAFIREFGTRRPQELFPLPPMMQGLRIGHRVLWGAVLAETGKGAQPGAAAAELAGRLLHWVDGASAALERTYGERRHALAGSANLARETFFEDTLSGLLYAREDARGRAAAAGLVADADYVVAALALASDSATSNLEAIRAAFELSASAAGRRPFVVVRGSEVVVVLTADQTQHQITDMLRSTAASVEAASGVPVIGGVSGPCRGLAEVPRALERAILALHHARVAGGIVSLDEVRVFEYLLSSADPTARRLTDRRVAPLLAEDSRQHGTLKQTFAAYIDCDLNVVRTADTLGLHANTIRARLTKIESLTGLDTRRVGDVIELTVWFGVIGPEGGRP